ncbi:MAG: aldose 1-epimerase [Spirochaetota bacterium]
MRFEVTEQTVEGVETVCLRDTESGAAAHILPQLGGTVWRLALGAAILESDRPGELEANPGFRGRLLLPFNDRIPAGHYRFDGREYELPVNDAASGCAVHGLVYDRPFTADTRGADDSHASLELSYRIAPGSFPGYPFALRIIAGYRLDSDRFELSLAAMNEGEEAAPITMGWHPYIATPGGVDAARMTCPAGRFVEVDRDLLPTGALPSVTGGRLDFATPRRIGARQLDIALERIGGAPAEVVPAGERRPGAVRAATARTVVERGEDAVILEQGLPPFRYTQLYIPPQRTSIAVEPVSGATDAFNRPELGLRWLAPGEGLEGRVAVRRERAGRPGG